MIFLLDTTAFSDLMRGNARAEICLSRLSPMDRVVICPIVRGEVRYGIERLTPGTRDCFFPGVMPSSLHTSRASPRIPAPEGHLIVAQQFTAG